VLRHNVCTRLWKERLLQLIQIGVLGFLCLNTLFYGIHAFYSITFPYQIDYGEGFLLHQAVQLSEGLSIYQPISDYPLTVANYGPVYPLVWSGFIKLFGVSFFWGRLISVLSTIGICSLIYLSVRQSASKSVSIAAAMLFLVSPYIYEWSHLSRVDMLGIFLSVAGLTWVYHNETGRRIYWSIPLFVLAIFTKVTFVAAPLAACLYLGLKDRKVVIWFSALLGGSVAVILVGLNVLADGQFLLHTIRYNQNQFLLNRMIAGLVAFGAGHGIFLGLAMVAFALKSVRKEAALLLFYGLMAALMSFTYGKVGSSVNYYLEILVFLSLAVGLVFRQAWDKSNHKPWHLLTSLCLLVQLMAYFHVPFYYRNRTGFPVYQQIGNISKMIQSVAQPILSEDAGILVLNDKQIWFQPFIMCQLSKQGIWNQGPFVRDIQANKYGLILLNANIAIDPIDAIRSDRFTLQMIQAIRNSYRLSYNSRDYYLYIPKDL